MSTPICCLIWAALRNNGSDNARRPDTGTGNDTSPLATGRWAARLVGCGYARTWAR